MARSRVDLIDRDIELMISQDLSPEAQSATLAAFARESLAEAQEANRQALGRTPPHETTVDGKLGAAVETVRPDGTIVFEFDLVEELFAWIADQLVRHAPVGQHGDQRPGHPGFYRRSFAFFADGVEVAAGAKAPFASEYVFLNLVPYARKIEGGLSDQSPDGVLHAVAVLASRRFGNIAAVKFTYRSLQEGGLVSYVGRGERAPIQRGERGRFAKGGGRRIDAKAADAARERETRVPAILVRLHGA